MRPLVAKQARVAVAPGLAVAPGQGRQREGLGRPCSVSPAGLSSLIITVRDYHPSGGSPGTLAPSARPAALHPLPWSLSHPSPPAPACPCPAVSAIHGFPRIYPISLLPSTCPGAAKGILRALLPLRVLQGYPHPPQAGRSHGNPSLGAAPRIQGWLQSPPAPGNSLNPGPAGKRGEY